MESPNHPMIKRIAFIDNHLPRQRGIATFTTDLCEAVEDKHKDTACYGAADSSIVLATGSVRAMLTLK